jgi:death on curing protein
VNEPRWISEAALLAIHAQQVERFGGLHGVRDKNAVESALARPNNRWAHDSAADMADLAATYLVGFARSQGFNDGNKRTGLACALVFLAINGLAIHVPPSELFELTMSAAIGKSDDASTAEYLRHRLVKSAPAFGDR